MLDLNDGHDDLLQRCATMHKPHPAALPTHPHDSLGNADVGAGFKAELLARVVGEDG